MSLWDTEAMHCMSCHQICSGVCLASHRDRYCCHNPSCVFHAPCPAPPEADDEQAVQTGSNSNSDAVRADDSPTDTSVNSNVACRETIMREWRWVNAAAAAQVSEQTAAMDQTSSSTPPPAVATNDPPSSAHDDTPEAAAMFTIEEIVAQARLLSQFQQPQSRRRQRGQEIITVRFRGA